MPTEPKINWAKLKDKFLSMKDDVNPFRVPSDEEIKLYELNRLTYGLIGRQFPRKEIRWGYALVSRDRDKRTMLRRIAREFGFDPSDGKPLKEPRTKSSIDVIERSLEEKIVSAEFVDAWAELQFVYGMYVSLFTFSENDDVEFEQALHGVTQGTTIHECWYAYWIKAHSRSLLPRDRKAAEQRLEKLLIQIRGGERQPSPPYPLDWYGRMLGEKGQSHSLRSTYRDLSKRQLEKHLADPRITPSVLSPLTESGFLGGKAIPRP